MSPRELSSTLAALIPVKDFTAAKGRLAESLPASEREALARRLVDRVVDALRPLDISIACDDEAVAEWATSRSLSVIWCPGTGLNGAVTAGRDHLAAAGAERVLVTHGDLPFPDTLTRLDRGAGVILVPDRHGDGTNVLVVPTAQGFVFQYGRGSFKRHLDQACRIRLGATVVVDTELSIDIDTPEDLDFLERPDAP